MNARTPLCDLKLENEAEPFTMNYNKTICLKQKEFKDCEHSSGPECSEMQSVNYSLTILISKNVFRQTSHLAFVRGCIRYRILQYSL